MPEQANIWTKLGFDGRGFEAGMLRAQKSVGVLGKKMAATFAAFFSIGIMTRAIQKTIDWGSATSDLAISIGITNEELQELEYAVRKTGGSVETAAKSFKKLSMFRNMALETKGNRYMKISEALGVSRTELMALDTPMKLFERFAEIMRTKNFGAAQAGILSDLFGRGGMEMMPLFLEGLKKLRQEAHDLGLVVSDEVVIALDDMKDKQEQIIQQLRGPFASSLATVYSGILKLLSGINALAAVLANIDFSNLDIGEAFKTAKAAIPKDMGPIGAAVKPYMLAATSATIFGTQIGTMLREAVDKGIEQWSSDILGEKFGLLFGKQIREVAGGDFVNQLANEKLAVSRAASFKPASDALARIGGFVGRGAPAVNYAKLQLDVQKKIQRDTKRTADALGPGI